MVLVVGETEAVPPDALRDPTPLSMLEEVELPQVAVRVDELPEVMEVGEAVREAVGAVATE